MKQLNNYWIELDLESCSKIEGGNPFLIAVEVIAVGVGLYEFGYQYASRHLKHAK